MVHGLEVFANSLSTEGVPSDCVTVNEVDRVETDQFAKEETVAHPLRWTDTMIAQELQEESLPRPFCLIAVMRSSAGHFRVSTHSQRSERSSCDGWKFRQVRKAGNS